MLWRSSPLLEKSNGTWVSESLTLPREVAIVSTGGTIASVQKTGADGVVASLAAQELLSEIQLPKAVALGQTVDLARANSWNVDPDLMWTVARTVNELATRDGVQGVVVTHGTDTIEETAFLVDVLTPSDKPVVFTAAMRSADTPSADGPHNLETAIRAAVSGALRGLGTLVCLNDELYAARSVRKWHTYSTAAFTGGNPVVAKVGPDRVVRRTCGPLPRWTLKPSPGAPQLRPDAVPVIEVYSGMSEQAFRSIVTATAPAGIVLEGFGLGHVPESLLEPLTELVADGVPVVIATRVPSGGTWAVYGGPGSGTNLAALGVLRAGALSAAKARLLLMACLTGRLPTEAMQLFQEAVSVLGQGAEEARRS